MPSGTAQVAAAGPPANGPGLHAPPAGASSASTRYVAAAPTGIDESVYVSVVNPVASAIHEGSPGAAHEPARLYTL